MQVPEKLNLGSGKDFRQDCINVDVNELWSPDIVADLSRPFPNQAGVYDTRRFGELRLEPNSASHITAFDVLEHVSDLPVFMTSCLGLLRPGGHLEALVPYDLSFGAWQDPTHVRAFNERSWLYYTDWFWYMGWTEARFVLEKLEFSLNDIGRQLKAQGMDDHALLRTPRAVDSMLVKLQKTRLDEADLAALARFVPPAGQTG